jgi:hypothetical protein
MKNTFKFEKALLDPVREFGSPEKVVDEKDLTNEEKLVILKLWAHDAKLLAIADEENMGGSDSDILQRITICINKIKNKSTTLKK